MSTSGFEQSGSSCDGGEKSQYDDHMGLTHECGVFGCISSGPWPSQLDVANVISLALVGLQHRGQESAGIVTGSGESGDTFNVHRGMGLVSNIYNADNLSKLNGNLGIGHTRYSTQGKSELQNCQPFVVDTMHGQIAVAHNGELVNKNKLREDILKWGIGLSSSSDSEVITQILCFPPKDGEPSGPDWLSRIKFLMQKTPLAYSLLLMNGNEIYALRDPYGNRPLCVGKLVSPSDNEVEGWVVSSESCVFHSLGANLHYEVGPGEIIKLTQNGVSVLGKVPRPDQGNPALCIFEYVYFARPDSVLEGQMVYSARYRCGVQLAIEAPVEADVVSTVPESATPAAFGYAAKSELPFVEVLAKNRYIGRTFIQPSKRLRQLAVSKKFGPLRENLEGKRVVLVDDSIVRGNTMGPIVKMLRQGGAKEVHIRIASPPIRHPCYMGINIPTPKELIANSLSVDEIAKLFDADSLAYLSLTGLVNSVQSGITTKNKHNGCSSDKEEESSLSSNEKSAGCSEYGHCVACLNGKYPVNIDW
uniref:amidophosphoribosyltransferase-like n=1 Tax=Styela clava TaxID=7725 RepID=UPI001939C473|nr:amidophosphoribosyltransferase-like [Styela clava]